MRRHLDFYETPPWQTRALLKRVTIPGKILECCVGDGSLARELPKENKIYTNDIDPNRVADFNLDASKRESWNTMTANRIDSVVTNPPFNASGFDIVKLALLNCRHVVAILWRLSFLEPTKARERLLFENPPDMQIVLPRWSYKANGRTDSVTTA